MPKAALGFSLFAGAFGLAGLATYLYANRIAARDYRLERVKVWLDEGATGSDFGSNGERRFSILHLSDLHLHRGDEEKAQFLRTITDDNYDIVVITGDIFESESGIAYASSLLSRKPRLGAFAVLGNHDYYAYTAFNKTVGEVINRYRTPSRKRDVEPFVQSLEAVGYRVLRNEIVRLAEEKLAIVGIDYPTISKGRLGRLVGQADPEELLIALFHVPKNLDMISQSGIKLALGGHTHGGQVRLPGVGALVTRSELPRHEASGLLWRRNTAFHISRGLGTDPLKKVRLFCPPAATIIEVMSSGRSNRPTGSRLA